MSIELTEQRRQYIAELEQHLEELLVEAYKELEGGAKYEDGSTITLRPKESDEKKSDEKK